MRSEAVLRDCLITIKFFSYLALFSLIKVSFTPLHPNAGLIIIIIHIFIIDTAIAVALTVFVKLEMTFAL